MLSGPTNSKQETNTEVRWWSPAPPSHQSSSAHLRTLLLSLSSPLSRSASSLSSLCLLLLHPVLSSSFPISLSSIPASSRQFQISAKAVARRLDAYCCHRNRPSALDYNVTLSPRQGYNVCSFLCLTRYMPARLLFVWTPVSPCAEEVVPLPACFLVIRTSCMLFYRHPWLVVTHLNFKISFQVKVGAFKFTDFIICEEDLDRWFIRRSKGQQYVIEKWLVHKGCHMWGYM